MLMGYRFVSVNGVATDYATNSTKVFTDSASTCNYVPRSYYEEFGNRLGAYAGSYTLDGQLGYVIDCSK